MVERYFITNAGLAAAVKDPTLLAQFEALLRGEPSSAAQRAAFIKKGWLSVDRRPPKDIDNNLLVLSGALERVHEALADVPPKKKPNGEDADAIDEPEDLRTRPRRLYRLRADHPVLNAEQLRTLPSGARRVYAALRRSEVGTTKSLAEATGLNRRTVENSIGALRKARLLEDFDYTR